MSSPAGRDDPKGLIAESFLIDGITDGECRTIFLDWALSLPGGADIAAAAARLAGTAPQGHPMTLILAEAAARPAAVPTRRGGSRARR